MTSSPKKVKKEGFVEYRFYQNIPGTTKMVQSYLAPLRADLHARPGSQSSGERFQDQLEYFVRFANEHVLRAFLCYLGGGQLPGLERIGEETSVELVEQRLEAFKKYYAASSKELEKLDEEEVARGVREVYRRYLFLDNVDKAYKEGQDVAESESAVALLVIKKDGGILLGALKRTPPQADPKGDGNNGEDVYVEKRGSGGSDGGLLFVLILAIFCALMLIGVAHFHPGIIGDKEDHFTFVEYVGYVNPEI